jgi:hypothetical protein
MKSFLKMLIAAIVAVAGYHYFIVENRLQLTNRFEFFKNIQIGDNNRITQVAS